MLVDLTGNCREAGRWMELAQDRALWRNVIDLFPVLNRRVLCSYYRAVIHKSRLLH
jgi:hypothetical protein